MSAAAFVDEAPTASVLVVDDDEQIVALFSQVLTDAGYAVTGVNDIASASEVLGSHRFDLAILDLNMPDGSGIELVEAIGRSSPLTAVMLVTADGERGTAADARLRGADAYLVKPVVARQLLIAADGLLHARAARSERNGETERNESDAFARLIRVRRYRRGHGYRRCDATDAMGRHVGR